MNGTDIIRVEQFRQLKKEIRGSEEHMIVGIDVAKERQNVWPKMINIAAIFTLHSSIM